MASAFTGRARGIRRTVSVAKGLPSTAGQRVRLDAGSRQVGVSAPGSSSWDGFGICGGMHIYEQHSNVIFRNVEGEANLSC